MISTFTLALLIASSLGNAQVQASEAADWQHGPVELRSIGPMTFGPPGILFVSDPEGATIIALDLNAAGIKEAAAGELPPLALSDCDQIFAELLGTSADEVRLGDLAVDPRTGAAYVGLTRGGGESARPLIARVTSAGEPTVLALEELPHMRTELDNAPEPGGSGRRNRRAQSITDLEFHAGQLIVAGLSNEEFASKLRVLAFPFKGADTGGSVEIYHASHDAMETRSPVRTFLAMDIGGSPHIVAGYTCTPLVKFPLEAFMPDEKVVGTTVAELGNRNTPLDMVLYESGGEEFLLIANTSRGVMKVSTAGIDANEGLTEQVASGKTAGLEYETVAGLEHVTQLAALDGKRAVVLIQPEDGGAALQTIELP